MKKKNIRNKILLFLLIFPVSSMANDVPILANAYARNVISLDGKWNYIIDPLENGYYDYRMQPYEKNGFFENKKAKNPQELVEYNFDTSPLMDIPSDWNTKNTQLFFYEGTIWFKKDFTFHKSTDTRTILYFGAVNYDTKIYLNGKKVGEHIGGFTPFNFDITNEIKEGNNFLILKVDNKRQKEGVPTLNMDWWNYGGITRDVMLITVPEIYIEDYAVQYKTDKNGTIFGWIKLNKPLSDQNLFFEIPELKIKQSLTTNEEGIVNFEIKSHPKLWSPTSPKLYEVKFSTDRETFSDQIGFRTIE
ncbi:MAG TPA: beta-glucuronidase, partial [Paludibacteraceae bacterium]|nr:beta-glucuronidase [Paludibacteraceae bacterium]